MVNYFVDTHFTHKINFKSEKSRGITYPSIDNANPTDTTLFLTTTNTHQ